MAIRGSRLPAEFDPISPRRLLPIQASHQLHDEPPKLHGNGTMLPAETQNLTRRLLANEAIADKTSDPTEPAAFRVYEKLRQPLCALAGVAGFRSLVSRALTLAKAEAPVLSQVQVTAVGSLQGLGEFDPQIDEDFGGAQVILISQLLGLLLAFIGEALTLRLVQEVWPDAAIEEGDSANGRDHEPRR